jgi:polyphosphate glucokinase
MTASPRTLALDIGGTHIKGLVLNGRGRPVGERRKLDTPDRATPRAVVAAIATLARSLPVHDRASVGFPGVIIGGVVRTAPNLHPAWIGVNAARRFAAVLGCPVRVANDADIQGLGVVRGEGVELTITLGTGVGSALFVDGTLVPNLEMGHHPFHDGKSYEDLLSDAELRRIGHARWRHRLRAAVDTLRAAFNPRRIYLGGGNARLLRGKRWPRDVVIVDNIAGLLGGARLWGTAATIRPRGRAPRITARGPRRPPRAGR